MHRGCCILNYIIIGPFFCAQDKVTIALSSCTVKPDGISVSKLVAITHATALTHTIDNPNNMQNDRVFIFSGTLDTVIVPGKFIVRIHF